MNEDIHDTAIIVDMSGSESIKEGIALAKKGLVPIPVYNGVRQQEGSLSTVDNKIVQACLIKGAELLRNIEPKKDACPAFLLDSDRKNRFMMKSSMFDNSWDIYHQDLPSCEYFFKNNIINIIIRGEKINDDVNKILYKFQKKGMNIFHAKGYEDIKRVKLKKPKEKQI